MVDVFQKHVQGGDALRQSLLDLAPFIGRDDPWKKVIGKDALGSLLVAVNRESDALMQEGQVGGHLALAQLFRRKFEQRLKKILVMRPRHTWRLEHLIVGGIELIIPEWGSKQRLGRLRHSHPSEHTAASRMTMRHPKNSRPHVRSSPIESVYGLD